MNFSSMVHSLTEKEARANQMLIEERNRANNQVSLIIQISKFLLLIQTVDKEEALRQLDNVRKELKRDIEEQLASQQSVIEMLSNDNSKLKQQKAEVRCDYLKTRKELVAVKVSRNYKIHKNARFQRELEFLKQSYEQAEKTENELRNEMSIEKTLRRQALDDMEKLKVIAIRFFEIHLFTGI